MTAPKPASAAVPRSLQADFRPAQAGGEGRRRASPSAISARRSRCKRKLDGSEVSEADLAVDAALKHALCDPRPAYGWLSEESEDNPIRLERRFVWMVDPIDGTNAFLRHVPEWTISVALVEDGAPVLGIVFNPATQEFFHAVRGEGAFLNDAPIKVSGRSTA